MAERPILFSGESVRQMLSGSKTQTRRVANRFARVRGVEILGPPRSDPPFEWWPISLRGVREEWSREVLINTCPYGQPGDRLWVREAFWDHDAGEPSPSMVFVREGDRAFSEKEREFRIEYRADQWDRKGDPDDVGGWKPSIHMPRWASRLTLEITEVRVQRLQEITEGDATAEGFHAVPAESWWQGYRDIGYEGVEHLIHQQFRGPAAPNWMIEPKLMPTRLGDPGSTTAAKECRWSWDSLNAKRGYGWDTNPWVWAIGFRQLLTGGPG